MGNSQRVMPKVDFESSEELKKAESYSKYIEARNFERVVIAKRLLRKKRVLASIAFGTVLGIYAYTILRVKQETFLDDFEEPPRIIRNDN